VRRQDQTERIDLAQWTIERQRLSVENIQRRAGNNVLIEGLDQLGLLQSLTARGVHNKSSRLHHFEFAHAEHAASFTG
jgi:hypothetical protein